MINSVRTPCEGGLCFGMRENIPRGLLYILSVHGEKDGCQKLNSSRFLMLRKSLLIGIRFALLCIVWQS